MPNKAFSSVVCRACATEQVLTPSEINPDYDGDWRGLGDLNVKESKANSRYYIVKDSKNYLGDNKNDMFINGDILVASWSTEPGEMPNLFFDTHGAAVDSLECSGETLKDAIVYLGVDEWGTALDCERGPRPLAGGVTGPPAIILTNAETGVVSVVVEESSSYPSFLYSVWTAASASSVDLAYTFHISSTVRLAEAVVTGIVNGETSGGGCFGLLRMFSETRASYEDGLERASPFGEHPTGDTVNIENLETIEAGVEINMNALLCLVWVLVLTAVGIAWSICVKSKIGLDVYDRDELLRAVSLQGQASEDPTVKHSAIRLFVRREDKGNLTVFINDAGGKDDGDGGGWSWRRFLRLRGARRAVADANASGDGHGDDPEADVDPESAQLDDRFGGAVVPIEGTVSLGNSSGGTDRFMSASPVRSTTPSLAATPVHHHRGSGVGGDAMFDSPASSDGENRFFQNATTATAAAADSGEAPDGLGTPPGGSGDANGSRVVIGRSTSLDSRGVSSSPSPGNPIPRFRPWSPGQEETKTEESSREEETKESSREEEPKEGGNTGKSRGGFL